MTELAVLSQKTREILEETQERYGFIPNLYDEFAKAPASLRTYVSGLEAMQDAELSQPEQQAVQLTVAAFNDCHYCKAVHASLGDQTGVSEDDLNAIVNGELPEDERIANLVKATRLTLEKRGWLEEDDLGTLEANGIDRQQLYEIITLIGMKTISNYVNHIAATEIDPQFK